MRRLPWSQMITFPSGETVMEEIVLSLLWLASAVSALKHSQLMSMHEHLFSEPANREIFPSITTRTRLVICESDSATNSLPLAAKAMDMGVSRNTSLAS